MTAVLWKGFMILRIELNWQVHFSSLLIILFPVFYPLSLWFSWYEGWHKKEYMVNKMPGICRYCSCETEEKISFYDTVVVLFPHKLLDKQKDSVSAYNPHENGVFGENLNMHSIVPLIYFSIANATQRIPPPIPYFRNKPSDVIFHFILSASSVSAVWSVHSTLRASSVLGENLPTHTTKYVLWYSVRHIV